MTAGTYFYMLTVSSFLEETFFTSMNCMHIARSSYLIFCFPCAKALRWLLNFKFISISCSDPYDHTSLTNIYDVFTCRTLSITPLQDYKLFDYAGSFSQVSNVIEIFSHLLSSSCFSKCRFFPSKFLGKSTEMASFLCDT